MRQRSAQQHITSLAALLLLAVFAVSILLALLAGASVYRRMTDRDQQTWEGRTATRYIATRVRQEDRAGALAVEDFGGVQALVLGAGEDYLTRLYCYDGALWELYAPAELAMAPEDGERLLELREMSLTLSDGLLEVDLTPPSGPARHLTLDLRSGEGAAA